VFRSFALGEKELEEGVGPDSRLRSPFYHILLKHRRYLLSCETEEEAGEDRGFHLRFEGPVICRRVYEAGLRDPVIGSESPRVIRLPCILPEKGGNLWVIAPGTSAAFFFFGGREGPAARYTDAVFGFIAGRAPGAERDGNDIMINGRKAGGADVFFNPAHGTIAVALGLNYDAAGLKKYEAALESYPRKYAGLSGFRELGMGEEDFCLMVEGIYGEAKCL
jgi:hypothetical protein